MISDLRLVINLILSNIFELLFFKNHFTTKKIKNKIGAPIEIVLKNMGLLFRTSQTNSNCKLNDKKIRHKSINRSTILSAIIVPNNFSKGISYFATSAIYYNKNEPEAAVVYDPIKDELYYAKIS